MKVLLSRQGEYVTRLGSVENTSDGRRGQAKLEGHFQVCNRRQRPIETAARNPSR